MVAREELVYKREDVDVLLTIGHDRCEWHAVSISAYIPHSLHPNDWYQSKDE